MIGLLTYKKNNKAHHSRILGALLLTLAIPQVTHAQAFDAMKGFFQFLYSFGTNPIDGLLALLGTALQKIAAFFLWIVSGIFDSVLKFTVVDLSQNIAGISAITTTWGIIRDLINISFIFILLYIAIGTILNLSGVNWKGTLVKVIVAAILINFSLFFTRTAIDISNILALTFYNALTNNGAVTISSAFADRLNISTLYGSLSGAISNGASGELILAGVGGTILILVTTFVFLATTLLFVSRFVTLIFLLILSPVGFFGSVLPGLGSAASKWRSTLMGQLIFAPVFMILTWVTLQILNDPSFAAPTGATLNQAFAPGTGGLPAGGSTGGFMQMFMNYAIATTFMIATLVISKSAASQGSALGQKLVGSVAGAAVGASGWAGRKSLGRVGKSMADSEYLKSKAPNSRMARLALQGGNKFAKGSYDFRESKFANMGKSMGVDMNLGIGGKSGGKGGYDAYIKDQVKKEKGIAESFKPSDIAIDKAKTKVAVAASPEDKAKAQEELDDLQGISKEEATKRAKKLSEEKAEQIRKIDRSRAEEAQRKMKLAQEELEKKQEEIKKATLGGTVQPLPQDKAALEAIERQKEEATQELAEAEAEAKRKEEEIATEIELRKAKTATERNDAGKERAMQYAESLTPKGNFGLNTKRVLFVGPVQKQYKQAAIELRKGGKKPLTKIVEDLLRENGDLPPEKPEEKASPETPKP